MRFGFSLVRHTASLLLPLACIAHAAQSGPADLQANVAPTNALFVDTLDLSRVTTEAKDVVPGESVWHRRLTLHGITYPHGFGVQGVSEMTIDLKGVATSFESMVGVDDEIQDNGAVDFTVRLDGREVYDSGTMHGEEMPKHVVVDLTGAQKLTLAVAHVGTEDDWRDHADWAGALIRLVPSATARPATAGPTPRVQVPVEAAEPTVPAIHGPRVLGVSPQRPFLYTIPATGKGELDFRATDLPAGVSLDARTGLLHGKIATEGRTTVTLIAHNALGSDRRELTIVCGAGKRALTPPMGWNAFGVYGDTTNDAQVRAAADDLVKTGLAAHGYRYVCLGDAWEGTRDDDGNLRPNRRFPDMRALADYIHARGLLFGIYSAATPQTCSGYVGSVGHEAQDARTFADWGVDYLTYDWCPTAATTATNPGVPLERLRSATAAELVPPFTLMGDALEKTGRDIVYAVSVQETQRYTSDSDDPVSWAAKVGADTFSSSSGLFDSDKIIRQYALGRLSYAGRAGVDRWDDLGLLMAGRIGYPKPHLTLLTPAEQMTQMTAWAMLSAPLFVSCDLAHLNANLLNHYTSALLTNDDILDIDQEPTPHAPKAVYSGANRAVWFRTLADGRIAVAFFNGATYAQSDRIALHDLGLTGPQPVHDLWQRRDLPTANNEFSAVVPNHGVVFVVIGRAKAAGGA